MVLTYEDLKSEFRLTYSGDVWGNCMGWWFAVAGEMYERGLFIPPEWKYRPSPMGGRDPDAYETEICLSASDDALVLFGSILARLSEKLRAAGKDY